MIRKKSRFWTFCFSFVPGAAEMYMGFMKMGLSLMTIFFGLFALGLTLELGPVMVLVAISWFYSFFHAHNLAGMPEQEFYEVEDAYLFTIADIKQSEDLIRMNRKTIAAILIFIGGVLTWKTCMSMLYGIMPYEFYNILNRMTYRLPQLVVGVAIIYLGVVMIRGKKVELDEQAKNNSIVNGQDNSNVNINTIEDKKEGN